MAIKTTDGQIIDSPVDIIGRPLEVGDHIVFHNLIYQIKNLYISVSKFPGSNLHVRDQASILLLNKSATTKSVKKYCHELTLLPKGDMLMYLLKRDAK